MFMASDAQRTVQFSSTLKLTTRTAFVVEPEEVDREVEIYFCSQGSLSFSPECLADDILL